MIEHPHIILPPVTEQEFYTIMAALAWYKECEFYIPQERPKWVHEIAINATKDNPEGTTTSLCGNGLDDMIERMNIQSEDLGVNVARVMPIPYSAFMAIKHWWKMNFAVPPEEGDK